MHKQQVNTDISFALSSGDAYVIVDGRGGATGSAPRIFHDNILVPTVPTLARAKNCLDDMSDSAKHVSLMVTG